MTALCPLKCDYERCGSGIAKYLDATAYAPHKAQAMHSPQIELQNDSFPSRSSAPLKLPQRMSFFFQSSNVVGATK